MTDLNELRRLHAETNKGDWKADDSFWIVMTTAMPGLLDELTALREDKARLDWLEAEMPLTLLRANGVVLCGEPGNEGDTLRAAIDKARTK